MEVNMDTRKIAGLIAAAFLISGGAASAQSKSPADEQRTQASPSNGTMTLVGCLVREADYRRAHKLGRGALGGVGLGDEFVLVDATEVPAGPAASESSSTPPSASSAKCSETGNGRAYRMTGKAEDKLKPFVGHRMQITGEFDHARDARTAAGETNAKLPPEIKIASYREAATSQAPASASVPPATPPVSSTPSEVASNQTSEPRPLPHTASNEPLIALVGLICLTVALGVRLSRVRLS
jgi:hypothetical protein